MAGLSALALALSAYLSWHYLTGSSVIGCTGGSSCDQVLTSRWSSIAGIVPVSGLALGAYLAMLIANFFIGPATPAPDRRIAWAAMLMLIGGAAGSAVWFTILQHWVIGAFCPYCMATHITGLLLAALVLWQAPRALAATSAGATSTTAPTEEALCSRTRMLRAIGLAAAGFAFAALLAASQIIFPPRAVYRSGESTVASLPAIDPHAVPLLGSPDAKYIVDMFFDYRCPHCQRMHAMLDEVIRRYDGKIAFALCPAPLNNQCNPYIARETEQFKDSCELAKISLAVWLADPKAFATFDQWMFAPPEPDKLWRGRDIETARVKAIELIGQARFDAARADPWIEQYMHTSIRIYGETIRADEDNAVPKLVFASRWVTPEPPDADSLISILQKSLGVPKP